MIENIVLLVLLSILNGVIQCEDVVYVFHAKAATCSTRKLPLIP
jgi:hypothetical protein